MSDPIAAVAADGVRGAIRRAAAATGVDFSLLVETARRESALDPQARASTSSARGLFQFIDSTWLDMVRRHGAEHGLAEQAAALQRGADPETRRDILALRSDPELSARMAGELARENGATLAGRLGRAATAGELYAAHVLGADGAARLIEAAGQGVQDAATLFPREAAANRGIFYANGAPRSAQQVLARLDVDASAAISARGEGRIEYGGDAAPMSPALAHILFNLALLPLLGGDDQDTQQQHDPMRALLAYGRASTPET